MTVRQDGYDEQPLTLANKAAIRRTEIVDGFRAGMDNFNELATRIYEYDRDQCWADLGCTSLWGSLNDSVRHQFGTDSRAVLKLRAMGRALAQGAPPSASGRALTQFAKLNHDPEKQKEAFKSARATAGADRVSEAVASKAVSRLTKKVKNTASRHKEPLHPEFIKGLRKALAIIKPYKDVCDEKLEKNFLDVINDIERLMSQ